MTALAAPPVGGPRRIPLPARWLARHWFAPTVLAVDAALLALAEIHHEPWFDEAQAWLLARDSSPLDLLVHHLRYEGSPPLWHLILMVPAKLGLPYGSLGVVSVLAALAGAAILLTASPFPRVIRALLVFSFFPLFEYGVVARSYALLGPLLFLLAATWPARLRRPIRLAVLLGLLANVSLHGFLIAGALAVLHLVDLRRAWPLLDRARQRRHRWAMIALAAVAVTVVAELYPPRDLSGGGVWHVTTPGDLVRGPLVVNQPIVVLVALAVLAVTVGWLRRTRRLRLFALPTAALLLLFLFRYFSPWHAGAIFLVWVFALWVSLEPHPAPLPGRGPGRLVTLWAMASLLLTQVAWTAMSVGYDWSSPYSGAAGLAAYIHAHHLEGTRIDVVGKWAIAALPYFDRDIFHNLNGGHGPSFYDWSTAHPALDDRTAAVLRDRPDVIVVAVKSRQGPSRLPCLDGYLQAAFFPGAVYLPWFHESEGFVVYRPARAQAPGPSTACGYL